MPKDWRYFDPTMTFVIEIMFARPQKFFDHSP
jgi:hypothetical protein